MDEEIRKVVMDGYAHAKWIIEKNRRPMMALAEALLEVESLEADEIKVLLVKAGATATPSVPLNVTRRTLDHVAP